MARQPPVSRDDGQRQEEGSGRQQQHHRDRGGQRPVEQGSDLTVDELRHVDVSCAADDGLGDE